jgi:hypothetical protein
MHLCCCFGDVILGGKVNSVSFELLLFVRSKSYVEIYIRIELISARS